MGLLLNFAVERAWKKFATLYKKFLYLWAIFVSLWVYIRNITEIFSGTGACIHGRALLTGLLTEYTQMLLWFTSITRHVEHCVYYVLSSPASSFYYVQVIIDCDFWNNCDLINILVVVDMTISEACFTNSSWYYFLRNQNDKEIIS